MPRPHGNSFKKLVATAGVPVPLVAAGQFAKFFLIRALSTNTGKIFIMYNSDDNVDDCVWISAEEIHTWDSSMLRGTDEDWNLGNIYIDAEVNGEGVVVEAHSIE